MYQDYSVIMNMYIKIEYSDQNIAEYSYVSRFDVFSPHEDSC